MAYHLAEINIALPVEPLDSPRLAEFVAALEPINALADESPGFVWRLQTEDGDATAIRVLDDERLRHLQANGPTAHAFTFRTPFPSPDGVVATDDEWFCPA